MIVYGLRFVDFETLSETNPLITTSITTFRVKIIRIVPNPKQMMTLPKFLARQGADRIVYRGMKGWGRSFSSVRGTALPINEFHAWYINQQHHLYCCASVRILHILFIILYFVYYIYYMLYIIYYILISNTTCTALHLCRARVY